MANGTHIYERSAVTQQPNSNKMWLSVSAKIAKYLFTYANVLVGST